MSGPAVAKLRRRVKRCAEERGKKGGKLLELIFAAQPQCAYPEKQAKPMCLRSCRTRWTFDTGEDNIKVLYGCSLCTFSLTLLINTRWRHISCMISDFGC